jgi:hypothetical protein
MICRAIGTAAAVLFGFWAAGAARAGDDHPQYFIPPIAAPSPATVRGEVALTDSPFCEFFVVGTERGFSLLDWRGGLYVIVEGDLLGGPLNNTGLHVFAFDRDGQMKAQIEEVGVNLSRAQEAYYSRCHASKPYPSTTGAVALR